MDEKEYSEWHCSAESQLEIATCFDKENSKHDKECYKKHCSRTNCGTKTCEDCRNFFEVDLTCFSDEYKCCFAKKNATNIGLIVLTAICAKSFF